MAETVAPTWNRSQAVSGSKGRWIRLPRRVAFIVAASSLILVFAVAGAPIPLLNTYRVEDGITNGDFALASVGYFVAAATALLVFGRVSNHLGRRPIGISALMLAGAGCVVLAGEHGVLPFTIARVLQGFACGLASSAIGAYVVDSAPARPSWLAAAITGGAPMGGVPLGAIASGALVEYGPLPRTLIHLVLFALLMLCTALIALSPETMTRRKGARASLKPRLQIPSESGRLLLGAGATFVATWSLGGFYQAFGPSVTTQYLGTADALVTAAVFSSVMVLNPLAGPVSGRLRPRTALRLGMALFVLALFGIVASLHAHALGPFILSSLLVGLAQGTASTGAIKALLARANASQRAGLLSTIYLIAYCGAAIPGLAAGKLSQSFDLLHLAEGYAALGLVASIVAVAAMRADARPTEPIVRALGGTGNCSHGERS